MLDGLIYAGVPMALVGLGGLAGCSYGFATSTVMRLTVFLQRGSAQPALDPRVLGDLDAWGIAGTR